VTLLGTGAPPPLPNRFGPSTLVEVGDQKLLFDAGRGVPIRLWQLRIQSGKIDTLFLTHFHSDHVSGIPDVWLNSWLGGIHARRSKPLQVVGPTGVRDLMSNLERAYAADIRIRTADEKLRPEVITVDINEFAAEGVVYEKDGVRVTAFEVNHGPLIKPSYGYRVDYRGHAMLISGDTKFDENVVRHGTGVDLLVHEVAAARPQLAENIIFRRILDHHTTPREAGVVFDRTKPKMAAYTHIVLLGSETIQPPALDDVIVETRQTYAGPLQVGEDLMAFDIGPAGVAVRQPRP
jgi:ribonuclease Z